MSEQLFKNGLVNLHDYEIVPDTIPENETPRQFVLRMTGKDFPDLAIGDRDLTWQELKDAGALPAIERIMQVTVYRPPVILRKKNP